MLHETTRKRILKVFGEQTSRDYNDAKAHADEARALYLLLDFAQSWPDYSSPYEFTKAWRQCDWAPPQIDNAIWHLLNSGAATGFWLAMEKCQPEKEAPCQRDTE